MTLSIQYLALMLWGITYFIHFTLGLCLKKLSLICTSSSDSLDFSSASMDKDLSGSVCFKSNISTEDYSQDDDTRDTLDSEGDFDQPLYPGSHLTFFKSHLKCFSMQYVIT